MKKTVCKKEYDTETMTVVKKVAHGVYGDPAGYEEILYVAADGKYFLYGVGGEAWQKPRPRPGKRKTHNGHIGNESGKKRAERKVPPASCAQFSGLRKKICLTNLPKRDDFSKKIYYNKISPGSYKGHTSDCGRKPVCFHTDKGSRVQCGPLFRRFCDQ